jgi:hypothetical protein
MLRSPIPLALSALVLLVLAACAQQEAAAPPLPPPPPPLVQTRISSTAPRLALARKLSLAASPVPERCLRRSALLPPVSLPITARRMPGCGRSSGAYRWQRGESHCHPTDSRRFPGRISTASSWPIRSRIIARRFSCFKTKREWGRTRGCGSTPPTICRCCIVICRKPKRQDRASAAEPPARRLSHRRGGPGSAAPFSGLTRSHGRLRTSRRYPFPARNSRLNRVFLHKTSIAISRRFREFPPTTPRLADISSACD